MWASMWARLTHRWCLLPLLLLAFMGFIIINMLPKDEIAYWVSERPKGPAPGCVCPHGSPPRPSSMGGVRSNCGAAADQAGPNQNVIAYSFYGDPSSSYFLGLQPNAELARQLYPGWRIRVYSDVTPEWNGAACQLSCRYPHVDFCDVHALPGLGDLSPWFGMIWRFMVLADPSVDRFIVRDTDSPLNQRERDAVDEWIASNLTFHVMRDNPNHGTAILGGMWGGRNHRPRVYGPSLRQKIIDATRSHRKQEDQRVLQHVLWPEIKSRKDVLQHDSYLCATYPGSRPFPSRRPPSRDFVGAPSLRMSGQQVKDPCPVQCRPPQHKDWLYC